MPIGIMPLGNSQVKLTTDGGEASRMINKTGANSVKGTIVEIGPIDKSVKLANIDDIDPCGIMFDDGVPDGGWIWVVTGGKAKVLYSTSVSLGTISRVPIAADESATNGLAINEALPVPPFATDKHFREIGHPEEAIGTPGLASTMIHFL